MACKPLTIAALLLALAACSAPPPPDPDEPLEPQATALRDSIEEPLDKARAVQTTQADHDAAIQAATAP